MKDQFEILESLGSGSAGRVFKARQLLVDRIVALKVLSSSVIFDETSLKRFQQEAQIASSLDHPNIAKVFSFGLTNESEAYLVMEYIEGQTLLEFIKSGAGLSLELFETVFVKVCSALEYAHSKGIVHRDIKPGNIMLFSNEEKDIDVKVLDFGIAKKVDGIHPLKGLTQTGVALGTPFYMSPEQCCGEASDPRSDIYSLACTMFESLTGTPPFRGESAADVMLKHVHESPPEIWQVVPGLSLPPSLPVLIRRCLSKKVGERVQSAGELGLEIRKACREKARKLGPSSGALKSASKSSVVIGLVLSMILIASGFVAYRKYSEWHKKLVEKELIAQTWNTVEAQLTSGTNKFGRKEYMNARHEFEGALEALKKLPLSEQKQMRAMRTFYRVYEGLSNSINAGGQAPQDYLNSVKMQLKYAEAAFGMDSEEALKTEWHAVLTLADGKAFIDTAEDLAKRRVRATEVEYSEACKAEPKEPFNDTHLAHVQCWHGSSLYLLGWVKMTQGNYSEALPILRKALELQRAGCGEYDSNTIWTMYRLCVCSGSVNRIDESKQVLKELLDALNLQSEVPPLSDRNSMLLQLSYFFHERHDKRREKLVLETLLQLNEQGGESGAPEAAQARQLLRKIRS